MASSLVRCGLAGWHFAHWNHLVYPSPRPSGFHPLQFLAGLFDTVEINTTFYHPPKPEIVRLWLHQVSSSPRFRFTVKLHRRFTHERVLDPVEVAEFRATLQPMLRAGRLGCILMQFPWSFRFTLENRDYFIALRRAFHGFPLAAEMRHSSWSCEEALGTFIDYHVGFVNIDQPQTVKAMPPSSFLTSSIGYVRLHGRNPENWRRDYSTLAPPSHDYLYSPLELHDWRQRIERIQNFASEAYVIFTNEVAGKSVVNALQMQYLLTGVRGHAPQALQDYYSTELREYVERPRQENLFDAA